VHAWRYEIHDVLRITRNGQEALARIARFTDSLDTTIPLYVNLRVAGGLRWSEAVVKIQPGQIIEHLPNWYKEQAEQWEAELSASAEKHWAKMSDAAKQRLRDAAHARARRSPLDILIDRACGRE
jgi:DNA-binding PadR family transcriptional regulator